MFFFLFKERTRRRRKKKEKKKKRRRESEFPATAAGNYGRVEHLHTSRNPVLPSFTEFSSFGSDSIGFDWVRLVGTGLNWLFTEFYLVL